MQPTRRARRRTTSPGWHLWERLYHSKHPVAQGQINCVVVVPDNWNVSSPFVMHVLESELDPQQCALGLISGTAKLITCNDIGRIAAWNLYDCLLSRDEQKLEKHRRHILESCSKTYADSRWLKGLPREFLTRNLSLAAHSIVSSHASPTHVLHLEN